MNFGHTTHRPNTEGLASQTGAFIPMSHSQEDPARQPHDIWPVPPMTHLQEFIAPVERSVGRGRALPDPVEDKHSFPSGELTSSAWEGWWHKEPTQSSR